MKKLWILFAIFLLAFSNSFSKDDTGYKAKEGDQAVLFNLGGLSELKPNDFCGGLGYQYYFMNHLAFRFAVGLDFQKSDLEKPETGTKDYMSEDLTFTLRPGIRYNIGTSSTVLGYIGSELIFSITKNVIEGEGFLDQKKEEKSNNFGLGFFLGAEWFAFRNVSLSAEYSFGINFGSGEETLTTPSGSETTKLPSTIGAGLHSSGVFTVSFYFN